MKDDLIAKALEAGRRLEAERAEQRRLARIRAMHRIASPAGVVRGELLVTG